MKLKKIAGVVVAVPAMVMGSIGAANATLPAALTGANGAFSTLSTDVLALIDLAWTAVIPVTVGFIVLRLFKKAASSAV